MSEYLKEIYKVEPQAGASSKYKMHTQYEEEKIQSLALKPLKISREEMPRKAIELLGKILNERKALRVYLDSCVRCGACIKQCHSYLATGDPNNTPVKRQELMRSVYRRYFTISGKIFGKLVGAEDLTPEKLDEWYTYYYQCTQCRRCAVFCPYGIDTAEITTAARNILAKIGYLPKYITDVISSVYKFGNNMALPGPAMLSSAEFVEEELKEETGEEIKLPFDKEKAEILYVPTSADFFVNMDTLKGVAKLFYAVGADWTMALENNEVANFGMFLHADDMVRIYQRIVDEAKKRKVKYVIAGECGHAWRTLKHLMIETKYYGDLPFKIMHIFEYTKQIIDRGKVKLDPDKNPERVTYHDPCGYSRAGDLIEEPREIIRAVCKDFKEMYPNRTESFCCGGLGLLAEEMLEFRLKVAQKVKYQQIKATGAKHVIAPCAICKAQFHHAIENGVWPDIERHGLMDYVGNALVFKA